MIENLEEKCAQYKKNEAYIETFINSLRSRRLSTGQQQSTRQEELEKEIRGLENGHLVNLYRQTVSLNRKIDVCRIDIAIKESQQNDASGQRRLLHEIVEQRATLENQIKHTEARIAALNQQLKAHLRVDFDQRGEIENANVRLAESRSRQEQCTNQISLMMTQVTELQNKLRTFPLTGTRPTTPARFR